MSFYSFLQAQLPLLSLDGKLPLNPGELADYVRPWLPPAEAEVLASLAAGEWPDHPVVTAFRQFDTALRNQLVQLRAARLNRDPGESLRGPDRPDPFVRQQLTDLAKDDNPEVVEKQLDQLRWQFIDQKTALDTFNFSFLIGYMLKLKLANRWAELDEQLGRQILQDALEESVREAIGTPR